MSYRRGLLLIHWSRLSCLVAVWLSIIPFSTLRLQAEAARAGTSISTDTLRVVFGGNQDSPVITRLTNLLTGSSWLSAPSPIYKGAGDRRLKTSLDVQQAPGGELLLSLQVSNTSAEVLTVHDTFPLLEGLAGGSPDPTNELAYCFPQKGMVASAKPRKMSRFYSSEFPLQFMDVYEPGKGGIYLMTRDMTCEPRKYFLNKTDKVSMGVYNSKSLEPGEVWTVTAVIGAHRGDWHEALSAYRQWVQTWYRPEAPRKPWFQEVFNFRQMFLHANRGVQAPGAFNPATKEYSIAQELEADQKAFGGVDYVHLFDWAKDPKRGRTGDYDTWDYLGGAERFKKEIRSLQAQGIHVGLYLEGYLVDHRSDIYKAAGDAWQVLNAKGQSYAQFGLENLYPCPFVPEWRDYLKRVCVGAVQKSGADGIYIDEYGFGTQYACWNKAHAHPVPGAQVRGEGVLMRQLRQALPPAVVLYSEETGTDVTSQYQDGSFTYSVSRCREENNPARLNLFRFALPDYKQFEIIRVDEPLGDDPEAVKHVFFNGEGIWLEGPLNDRWFPASACQAIAKTHRILRQYRDAFRTASPQPLVGTLSENVYANDFPASARSVWTLYNAGTQRAQGELLKVSHRSGAEYFDAWNGKPLTPRIVGSEAYLSTTIEPHDVGCIVQELRPTFSAR
jgi:hypothetical protein